MDLPSSIYIYLVIGHMWMELARHVLPGITDLVTLVSDNIYIYIYILFFLALNLDLFSLSRGITWWRTSPPPSVFWNYANSQAWCVSQGTTLVTANNYYKFGFIQSMYNGMVKVNTKSWVGAQATGIKTFTWNDGTPVNGAYFGYLQPDNNGSTSALVEGCLSISSLNFNMLNDDACSSNMDFICEYYSK